MTEQEVHQLVLILNKMKTLKRNMWIKNGMRRAESIAEHSYSLALLTSLLTPPELDRLKCLKMALVHDLPETYCGDFVAGEMEPDEKFRLELSAMETIASKIAAPELVDIFKEYETSASPEAKFVKALDKIDNVMTARLYYDGKTSQNLVCECASEAYPAIMNAETTVPLLSILQALF